jgi:hypothetical protein
MVEKKKAKKPQDIVPLMLRLREVLRQRLAKDAEKGAKSLNAEIVDRLEASYTKDERIEELRGRLDELRQRNDESRKALETDKEKFDEELRQHHRLIEEYRDKYRTEINEIQSKYAHLETATDMVDLLLGNEASSALLRRIVGTLAASPDWSSNAAATKEMASKIGQLIQDAPCVAGNVVGPLTGTVSATLPTSNVSNVTVVSGYVSTNDETVGHPREGGANEGPRSGAR